MAGVFIISNNKSWMILSHAIFMWFNAKMFVFVFSRPEQNNMSKLHSQLHTTPLGNKAQKFEYFKAYVSLKVVHPLINGNSILTVFLCIQYNTIMFHNYIFVLFEISFFLITLNSLSWWVIVRTDIVFRLLYRKNKNCDLSVFLWEDYKCIWVTHSPHHHMALSWSVDWK